MAVAAPFLLPLAIGTSLAGGAVSAYGAIQQGQAQAASADYNAAIAKQNASIARENRNIASQAAEAQAGQIGLKTRAQVAGIKTNQAASGINVNSGSAVDTQISASALGQIDALTIRSNAMKEAYGYEVQAHNYENQANLDKFQGEAAKTASYYEAGSSLLGSIGDSASSFAKYKGW